MPGIVLVGLIAWILSPIDLIPEFIPGLGPLDDVIVAIVAHALRPAADRHRRDPGALGGLRRRLRLPRPA